MWYCHSGATIFLRQLLSVLASSSMREPHSTPECIKYVPDAPSPAATTEAKFLSSLLNILAVEAYGESDFWLSGGKVILIFMLFSFTFVTMVGGNPKHDAYGFRYWNKPGAFAEHHSTGALGRFEGFLAALWSASFTVVGPEYMAIVAAEAKRPRIYIKAAFKTVYYRVAIFFMGVSLAVGIVCAYNDLLR